MTSPNGDRPEQLIYALWIKWCLGAVLILSLVLILLIETGKLPMSSFLSASRARMRLLAPFVLGVSLLLAISCPCHALGTIRQQLALTGDTTLGMDFGDSILGFRSPVISENGDVAFFGVLQGAGVNTSNDTGIWVSNDQSELVMVAREGSQAIGYQGDVRYISIADPAVDNLGNVYYSGRVSGSGILLRDVALWKGMPGSVSILAEEGEPLVGIPGSPIMGRARADYLTSGNNFSFSEGQSQTRIYYGTPTSLQQVVAAGDAAPGVEPDRVFHSFDPFNTNSRYSANGTGSVTFIAEYREVDAFNGQGTGIWLWDNGNLEFAASVGGQAPELPTGTNFTSLSRPVLNNQNELAFRGNVADQSVPGSGRQGIWSGKADAISIVALSNDFAPGFAGNVPFLSFDEPNLDGEGGVVFSANVLDPDTNATRKGVWYDDGTELRRVVYPGDPVPGLEPGATIAAISNGTVPNGGPLVNGRGDIAFRLGGSLPSGGFVNGYWALIDGELVKLAATGDLVDVNEDPLVEDLRRVISVGMIRGNGGEDGQRSAWSNRRQAVVELFFEDRTEGLYLVTVIPEPSTVTLLSHIGI